MLLRSFPAAHDLLTTLKEPRTVLLLSSRPEPATHTLVGVSAALNVDGWTATIGTGHDIVCVCPMDDSCNLKGRTCVPHPTIAHLWTLFPA